MIDYSKPKHGHAATGARLIAVLLLVASFTVAVRLPASWGWENGPIENMQALVLFVGALMALGLAAFGRAGDRSLWFAAAIVWIIMQGRELTWGAVFLTPIKITVEGPQFSGRDLWYHAYVTPILVILFAIAVGCFLYGKGYMTIARLFSAKTFPPFRYSCVHCRDARIHRLRRPYAPFLGRMGRQGNNRGNGRTCGLCIFAFGPNQDI